MPKKRPATKCNCIKQVNEKLREDNATLPTKMTIDFAKGKGSIALSIPLCKIDPKNRKPLPTLLVSYCPFCGRDAKGGE